MIFPFLNGIVSWTKAPVTWMIFILNALVLAFSYNPLLVTQYELEEKLKDDFFIESQGRLYAQFIEANPQFYSPLVRDMSRRVLDGDTKKLQLLGNLATRNKKFIEEGPEMEFRGDQVAADRWKRSVASLQMMKSKHPSYMLGLNAQDIDVWKWFSYIFVHSGLVHFVGNMLFFLIFAGFLETIVGGLAVLVLFLSSGALSAGFFLYFSGATAAPLVGASGAVSGIMAYFCFLYWNKPVRFVYWLFLPLRGYFGFIFLPGWVVFALWLVSDLAGYLSTVSELGGVAYTAHLGGEVIGLFVGLLISLIRGRYAGAEVPAPEVEMYKPIPFVDELVPKRQNFLKN